jgi:isopropylmalate/homocitrate/citramalate synthase
MNVTAPLLMVSFLTAERLEETAAELDAAGVTEIALFDGPGAMSPAAYAEMVTILRHQLPTVDIGLHPHNTFGLAVACAVSAVRAGANMGEVSINGYCGGPEPVGRIDRYRGEKAD